MWSWSSAVVMLPTAMPEYSLAACARLVLPVNSETLASPDAAPAFMYVITAVWRTTSAFESMSAWS